MRVGVSFAESRACFNPLRIGAIPQILFSVCLRFSTLVFQSPQNRGYSSDVVLRRHGHEPNHVSIPSESGLFLRLGHANCFHPNQNCFNPLRIGAIPQISTVLTVACVSVVVSIPSESGLFLRSCIIVKEHVHPGFNPLRIGAIPQIRQAGVTPQACMMFQSPQNRGYSSDTSRITLEGDCRTRFNPLRIGAIPQMLAAYKFGTPQGVSIPSESGLFLRSKLNSFSF